MPVIGLNHTLWQRSGLALGLGCLGLASIGIPVAAQNRPDVNDATSGSQTPTLFQDGNLNFTDLMQLTNQLQNPRPDGFDGGSSIDDAVQDFRSRREPVQIRTVSSEDEDEAVETDEMEGGDAEMNDEKEVETEEEANPDESISDESDSN